MAKASDIKIGESVYHKKYGYYLGEVVSVANGWTHVEKQLGVVVIQEAYANREIATDAEQDEKLAAAAQRAEYEAKRANTAREGEAVLVELVELLGGHVTRHEGYDAQTSDATFPVVYHSRRAATKDLNNVEIKKDLLIELLKVAGQTDARFAAIAESL